MNFGVWFLIALLVYLSAKGRLVTYARLLQPSTASASSAGGA